MKTLPTHRRPRSRRLRVYRRESLRGGRVSSLLAVETVLTSLPRSPSALAAQMAAHYFGAVPASCAGLVVASAVETGGNGDALCGFVLHPVATGRLPLIRLGPPSLESRPDYARLAYPISGGVLVGRAGEDPKHPGLGSFSFEIGMSGASTTCAVRVDDFSARILGRGTSIPRRLLYQGTESLVHRVLVARFLRAFVRSVAP